MRLFLVCSVVVIVGLYGTLAKRGFDAADNARGAIAAHHAAIAQAAGE